MSVEVPRVGSPVWLRSRSWFVAGCIVATVLVTFLLFWPSALALLRNWEDTNRETYTHGYVIAAICVWLSLRNRERFAPQPTPHLGAAALLGLLAIAWLVAVRAGIEVVHQALLPALMLAAIGAVFGLRSARAALFPVGYLYFAIQLWDEINGVLQAGTVAAVSFLLRVTSVPAYVEGNEVHLASGTFEIAGGCSGLHFFIVALALAALSGEIGRDTRRMRLYLVILAALLALMSNWLRVYTIILAGYFSDMQHYLVRVEHNTYGWFVFAVMMGVFFLIARRLPSAPAQTAAAPAFEAPMTRNVVLRDGAIALGALIAVPIWNMAIPVSEATLPRELSPTQQLGWSQVEPATDGAWSPTFPGADVAHRFDYRSGDGRHVALYVAAYASQTLQKELVGYGHSLFGPEDSVVARSRAPAFGPGVEVLTERHGRQAITWYFYEIGGRRTARDVAAQLWYALSSFSDPTLSKVVAIRAACAPTCDAARHDLEEFAKAWAAPSG